MKQLVRLTFLIFISLCSCESTSSYYAEVDRITEKFIKRMEKEYGFTCISTGGSMPYDLVYLDVDFSAPGTANIDEARKLEIECATILADMISSSEKLPPYLREYPLPISRANVTISFRRDSVHREDDGVDLVFIAKGKVFYEKNDKKTNRYQTIHVETLDEAVKIIQPQK